MIIPVFNQLQLTQQCLRSLLENSAACLDIVFVDDGSSDGTREWLASPPASPTESARLRFHLNDRNRGVNYCWNRGLELAGGSHVAVCNNDVIFAPAWDTPLLDALDAQPSLGIVSPYHTFGPETPADWPRGAKRRKNWLKSLPILGCCFVFRRELIAEIGPVPEGMLHFYGDYWFAWAAQQRGLRCGYARASYIHHFAGKTIAGTAWQQQVLHDERIYRQLTGTRCKKWGIF